MNPESYAPGDRSRAIYPLRDPRLEWFYHMIGIMEPRTGTEYTPSRSWEQRNLRAVARHFLKHPPRRLENNIFGSTNLTQEGIDEFFNRYAEVETQFTQVQLLEMETVYGHMAINYAQIEATPNKLDEPPIAVWPGASNHPHDVKPLAIALAMETGRKVVVLGYPEEVTAIITDKFYQAVMADTDFGCKPHLDIFKQATTQILGEKQSS